MAKIFVLFSLLFGSGQLLAQTADFNFQSDNGLYCNPSTISFTSTATGSPVGYVWTFGNNSGSNSANPTTTYRSAGTFKVTLIVIYRDKAVEVSKNVDIAPDVSTSINFDRNYICQPGVINFTASASQPDVEYDWNFSDGNILHTAESTASNTFSDFGEYEVTLKATTSAGCFASETVSVKVAPPAMTGTLSQDSGCIPATVKLTTTASIPKNSSVANYAWDFDDGSGVSTTTARSVDKLFANTGSYQPKVTVTTSEGCTNTFSFKTLAFGTPPTDLVAKPEKDVICGSDSAVFSAKATNANSYFWDFGDGTTIIVKGNQVKYKFKTLGVKTVTVTPRFNRCEGAPMTMTMEVVGVIASYGYSNTCEDKKTFDFRNRSQGNLSSVLWSFGDNSSDIETRNAVHTYPVEGRYVTRLTIADDITGCRDSIARAIYTAEARLDNPDSSICRGTDTKFTVENNFAGPSTTYTWNIAGKNIGPGSEGEITINADVLGYYNNNSVIVDRGNAYCNDTLKLDHRLLVRGPQLKYDAPSALCFGEEYEAVNSSKAFRAEDSILLWQWNYGEVELNDTIYQPEPYKFSRSGTYNVVLKAIDNKGCTDSLSKSVRINSLPFLFVIPQMDTLCAGQTDSLIAFNSGVLSWSSNVSLPCEGCDTLLVAPMETAKYIATATSSAGCVSTDSSLFKVYSPFTIKPSVRNPYICLDDSVTISVEPQMKRIEWTPASGISSTNGNEVIAFPRETTTYTVNMSDSVGCFSSSADVTVHVKSLPGLEVGPDQVLPYNSSFSISPVYGTNVASYNWSPSTNSLSCITCPNPSGIILNSETYHIEVVSDSGCVVTDSIRITLECEDANLLIPNAFTPNNDGLNDVFYPLARGIKTIRSFAVYDRFGKLVFEKKHFAPNDKSFGWNGKRDGMDQDSNVFVYFLEAECDLGQTIKRRGSVTLLR